MHLQVDTWAAGVTLYKAAFGVYPFAGSDTIDFPAAREAIMQGEVYYPSWTPPLLQAFLEVRNSFDFLSSWLI